MVRYRAIAGGVYDARLVGTKPATPGACVALAVIVPGCSEPVELSAIPFVDPDTGARGVCFKDPTDA